VPTISPVRAAHRDARRTEVEKACAPLGIDQDVRWLDVAVDHAAFVREGKRFRDREHELRHGGGVEHADLDVAADVEPVDEFHDEVCVAILERARGPETHQRGMHDRAQDAPLAPHAVDAALAEATEVDDLDGDQRAIRPVAAELDVA
jgi:hypothetical protein